MDMALGLLRYGITPALPAVRRRFRGNVAGPCLCADWLLAGCFECLVERGEVVDACEVLNGLEQAGCGGVGCFGEQGAGEGAVGEGELREGLGEDSGGEAVAEGGQPLPDDGFGGCPVGGEEVLGLELAFEESGDGERVGVQVPLGDDEDGGGELAAGPEGVLVDEDPAACVGELDVEGRRFPGAGDFPCPELLEQSGGAGGGGFGGGEGGEVVLGEPVVGGGLLGTACGGGELPVFELGGGGDV